MKSCRVLFRFTLITWLSLALLIGSPGCRDVRFLPPGIGPMALSEKERATLGVVGVTTAQFQPEATFETFAKGTGAGAGKGAAGGALEGLLEANRMWAGSSCQGFICGAVAVLWVASLAVGTTAGAIYGAVKGSQQAIPQEEAEKIEDAARKALDDLRLQERMTDAVLQEAKEKAQRQLRQVGAYGPASPGDKVDYTPLKGAGLGSVLEISVTQIGFETPPRQVEYDKKDPPLYLTLTCRLLLTVLSDGNVLYEHKLKISSQPRRRAEWEADNSKAFFDELNVITRALAEKVVDDVFITCDLPISLDKRISQ